MKKVVIFSAIALLLLLIYLILAPRFNQKIVVDLAKKYSTQNQHKLAAAELNKIKEDYPENIEQCETILPIVLKTIDHDLIFSAAVKCDLLQHDEPETYLAFSRSHFLRGEIDKSQKILEKAYKRNHRTLEILYKLARIYRRKNMNKEAAKFYFMSSLEDKSQYRIEEALTFLQETDNWEMAKQISYKIDTVVADEPELLLAMARTFLKYKQGHMVKKYKIKASKIMKDYPEKIQNKLWERFSDIRDFK